MSQAAAEQTDDRVDRRKLRKATPPNHRSPFIALQHRKEARKRGDLPPAYPMPGEPDPNSRILRKKEVSKRTGLAPLTIDRYVREGLFPEKVVITERAVGWLEEHVDRWIHERLIA